MRSLQQGFTLIELLLVLVILGILAAIVVPKFSGRTEQARITGTLDGVPVQVGAVVINRGACTYDFVYIASPERFAAGWEGFERVLAGFTPAGGELE